MQNKAAGAPPDAAPSAWPAFLTAYAVLIGEVERRFKQARLPGLAWYDVLWVLERAPRRRLRMHEMADAVVITRSNLTRLIDRLEVEGLVARARSPDDRRGAFAVLTASGQQMRKRMWPVYAAAIDELFDRHLSDAERLSLRSVLLRMLAAAPRT